MNTIVPIVAMLLVIGTCYVTSSKQLQKEHETEAMMEQQVKHDKYWKDVRKEAGRW